MRNLIVCCDGTWNSEDETDGSGLPVPTNVAKLFHACIKESGPHARQLAYYHSGVGTEGAWFQRIKGGAMGTGLGENVRSAYAWLAQTYSPGDQIFIFGFSRGAYTARALAGMIGTCGLLNLHDILLKSREWADIKVLFEYYRKRDRADWDKVRSWSYYNTPAHHSPKNTTDVHFVGVWDTVGSFGVPPEMGLLRLIQWIFPVELHDNQLGGAVVHARHAVALDENRATFMPTLWDERPGMRGAKVQSLKQVWFPGSHSDVGGGYADSGLSDVALEWMIDEATAQGMYIDARLVGAPDPGFNIQIKPDPLSVLHHSVEGVFKHLRTSRRPVPFLDVANMLGNMSSSTIARLANPTLRQGDYRPNLPIDVTPLATVDIYASQQWNETGIYLQKYVKYRFTADGEWIDHKIKCSPAGALPGQIRLGFILWFASWLLGEMLGILTKLSKVLDEMGAWLFHKKRSPLKQHDYYWTRRVQSAKWFTLIGMVANGTTGDDRIFEPNETFAIGIDKTFMPERDGYLYCFANDAWSAYENNHGSVRLTIKQL